VGHPPLLQSLEHALEGDLAVRAFDELGDLTAVDALAGAELEREPSAGTEVRGHVEPRVPEECRALVRLRLEDDAPGPLLGAGEDGEHLLACTEGRSPPRLDLARLREREAHVTQLREVRIVVAVHPGVRHRVDPTLRVIP